MASTTDSSGQRSRARRPPRTANVRFPIPLWALVLAALLLGAAGLAVLRAEPWNDGIMNVSVTISADGRAPVVHRAQILFSSSRKHRAMAYAEIDLEQWAGQVIRFDVRGDLQARHPEKKPIRGQLGCSAELVTSSGPVRLEFAGWQNDGSADMGFHVGQLGCQSFLVPGTADGPFVYAADDSLWHVVRVPENARLQVSFTPVMPHHVGPDPDRFIPPPASTGEPPLGLGARSERGSRRPPDVFVYVVDALRADHLGPYGYHRNTSPSIRAFAATATLYRSAYAAATWTVPSIASLLSGCYPAMHRAAAQFPAARLPEWLVLLPEALRPAGYRTALVSANAHLSAPFGFAQGFDELSCASDQDSDPGPPSCEWVNTRAAEFLAAQDPAEPVFMYLHTMEPHLPYAAAPDSFRRFNRGFSGRHQPNYPDLLEAGGLYDPDLGREDVEYFIDCYDACVFEADRGFGEFLDLLRRTGRFHNSLIILSADHGEAFLERDVLDHGRTLGREELQVPLIVRFPGGEFGGVSVSQPVSLIDLYPTILSVTGADPPTGYPLPGFDLALPALHPVLSRPRPIFAELARYGDNSLDLVCVIDEDGYKRVVDMSAVPWQLVSDRAVGLWDTRRDPSERIDFTALLPVRVSYHEQLIARWLLDQLYWHDLCATEPEPVPEVPEKLRRELEAVGYVE